MEVTEQAQNAAEPEGLHLVQNRADDARMVLDARASRDAFGTLYLAYVDPIYRFCYRRTGNPEQAADLTSQIFIKVMTNLNSCDPWKFRPWLFTIARHVLIDSQRGRSADLPLDTASLVESHEPSPEHAALAAEQRHTVLGLLGALTPDQRQVVELRLAGLNGNEIAEVLGRSRASVDTAQSRALARLKKVIASDAAFGSNWGEAR